MLIRASLALSMLVAATAWGQSHPERQQLLGSWQVEDGGNHETWVLENDGEMLRIARSEDGKVTFDLKCKPNGTDCASSDEGKKVKVSMYFNGSNLVQLETRDSYVTTRTFALDGKPDQMKIDVNPVTGPGKPYTLKLARHVEATAR
jgi:hypothetical protein